MSKFFNLDSPIMQALSKIADLVVLNVFCLICCLPVFTIGASVTALYDAVGRLLRDEGGIYLAFWKAFASNFKQATAQWLLLLVCGALLVFSLIFYLGSEWSFGIVLVLVTLVLLFLWCAITAWVFPLQSRFYNSVKQTLQNSLLCAIAYLPRTVVMIVLNCLPVALFFISPTVFFQVSVVFLFIWFSLVAYWNLKLLKKPFDKFTPPADEATQSAEALTE